MTVALLGLLNLPGGVELAVIGLLGLLLFGHRLPALARALGQSLTELRRGLRGEDN